jgi:hypothetical protein
MSMARTRLLAVDDLETATALFAQFGYSAPRRPLDLVELPLPGLETAYYLRNGRRRREGYCIVLGEAPARPRSLRALAKAIRDYVHDRPLGVLGIRDAAGRWERMIVFRPRVTATGGGISLTKLEVDLRHPTQHDARVLQELTWHGDDRTGQAAIDRALDVEAVTRAFFSGLREHHEVLRRAVQGAVDNDVALRHHLKLLDDDPVERVALRILTQVLFCEFVQRKGLLGGRTDWLTQAYRDKHGPYYQTVLEPLFYDALGTPVDRRRRRDLPEVPYLNGGLFERIYGPASLDLPDEVFDLDEGLLGYLDRWTFTISEEMPEEAEVAVDPEMLGRVFEHLAGKENVREHGTVYTPRPVVHFMCREALVPWLQDVTALPESDARHLLTDPDPLGGPKGLLARLGASAVAELAERLPAALEGLRVIDPAVGSGAFPLGMLSEIVRLRSICHSALEGAEADRATVYRWKLQAIQHVLFGVDIESRAIELCRLRLWLSLVVDLPSGVVPDPLPNLEFRTVVADSLVDFVRGIEIQNTRGGLSYFSEPGLTALHDRWFGATGDEKEELRTEIGTLEDRVVVRQLAEARAAARSTVERGQIDELVRRFVSAGRAFPCFAPILHAPDVTAEGGWDVVIMNPPYVGAKEVSRRLEAWRVDDLRRHYGDVNDLMIHFAWRALQLARPGGVFSMIFNDSIFTSTDAQNLRRHWSSDTAVLTVARTKCFEGKAVNGGVVVGRAAIDDGAVRWVEGYGRDVADLAEASDPISFAADRGRMHPAGTMEVWSAPAVDFRRLPHRPLFRPSAEALALLDRFEACAGWKETWSRWDSRSRSGWTLLSNTRSLERHVEVLRRAGFYDRLKPGDWVLLGLVIEGGQGLATADDRRFLAAVEGTAEAARHITTQERLESLTLRHSEAAHLYGRYLPRGRELALLEVSDAFGAALGWPRIGALRVAPTNEVRSRPLSDEERHDGISSGPHFVPFEKGDSSDLLAGQPIGARWWRRNPLVIDWSRDAVTLLRQRSAAGGARKPYWRNEALWFSEGVTWNRVASYFRCRQVPKTAIFSSESPLVRPRVEWLTPTALLALLNSDIIDFTLRTFLGSRMHIEIGDVRRLPVPVLDLENAERLSDLGEEAVTVKSTGEGRPLADIEDDVNRLVRALYGVSPEVELWVVR